MIHTYTGAVFIVIMTKISKGHQTLVIPPLARALDKIVDHIITILTPHKYQNVRKTEESAIVMNVSLIFIITNMTNIIQETIPHE